MATGDQWWAAVAVRAVGRGGGTRRAGAAAVSEAAEPAVRKKRKEGRERRWGCYQ